MEEQQVEVESPFANDPVEAPIEEEELQEEESPEEFEDDEEVDGEMELDEESDDSDEEDLSDEEIDELLAELDEEEGEEEAEEEAPNTVPHAALHKERERRKELQQQNNSIHGELTEAQGLVGKYEESLAAVTKQLKELDLLDLVDVEAPEKVSPELTKVRAQQKEQLQQEQTVQVVTSIREEAAGFLEEFPMIDGDNAGQAELIVGLALTSMQFGQDQEESVYHAMKTFNDAVATQRKADLRSKKPTRVKQSVASSKRSVRKTNKGSAAKAIPGNVTGFFDSLADNKLR
jgi:hypothetical protein